MKTLMVTSVFNAQCDLIYKFFIDSKLHSEVTGSPAKIDGKIGGKFHAWDKYIEGEIVDLKKNKRIIQKWRTTDFSNEDKDSTVEIEIEELPGNKSRLILRHSDLPEGTEDDYKDGWKEFYISPLKEYIKKNAIGK
jgi:activator of HSP90 ATPase